MTRIKLILSGLCSTALAAFVGCTWSDTYQQVKPPKLPDEYRAPPESESRYSRPMEYPKETMQEDSLLKKAKDSTKAAKGGLNTSGPGGGGGMAGRGF